MFERCTGPDGSQRAKGGSNGRVNEAAERAELLARTEAWVQAQQVRAHVCWCGLRLLLLLSGWAGLLTLLVTTPAAIAATPS